MKYRYAIIVVIVLIIILFYRNSNNSVDKGIVLERPKAIPLLDSDMKKYEEIYLAGGCFWGVEGYFERVEAVHIIYDPEKTDLTKILLYYFKVVDPTVLNRQGADKGTQYRTGIYYTDQEQVKIIEAIIENEQKKYKKAIVVEVEPIENYYLAEEYHQDYLEKNPSGYCHINLDLADEDVERPDLSFPDSSSNSLKFIPYDEMEVEGYGDLMKTFE